MDRKIKLSVALISLNEEENLPRTLNAIKNIADEIVIIDSGSTDRTPQIAKEFGAKLFYEEWKGFAEQKNSLIKKCSGEWILFLDCDEVVSPQLADEIKNAIQTTAYSGFYINRKTVYLGKVLNYAWQPDRKLRLVRADANPKWIGTVVHEELTVEGVVSKLKNPLFHYSYKNIYEHFTKSVRYAQLSAESYYQQGKKFKLYNLLINPVWAFCKELIIKRGFLDGVRGFAVAWSHSLTTFLKYLFLWEKYNVKSSK